MGKWKCLSFGNRVRLLREKNHWSQKELSDISGITQATISRIESGKSKELGSFTLRNLARVLGVTMESLLIDLRK